MSVSRTLYPLASTYVKCFRVRPRLLTSSYPAFVKCQQITRKGKALTGVPIDHRPISQRHFQTSSRIHGPQKRERNSPEPSRGTVGKHATPRKKSKRTNKPDEDVRDPCVMAYKIMSDKFGERYANPFTTYKSGDHEDWEDWGDTARTVVELRMCALSSSLREKQRWYEKIQDPSIRARWREEALSQALPVGSKKEWVLTEKMVDYVLAELDGYAKLRDEATGIEVACYERVWKSDSLVSDDDHANLVKCVADLESVPVKEQDWHPGSNGQVLDLVHPSLYPIIYGHTLFRDPLTGSLQTLKGPESASTYRSTRFAWLPSEFSVSANGTASLVSPYINNIHPKLHADLYPVIDRLVTLAVPLFERVLSDLRRPLSKLRIFTELEHNTTVSGYLLAENVHAAGCIWVDPAGKSTGPYCNLPPHLRITPMMNVDMAGWSEEQDDAWTAALPKRLPEALPSYDNALERIRKTVSLSGSTLQIVVKMANIMLTPENPTYAGGSWHVEGMDNEGIVSTFIYYYDEDNVTESRLAFRTSIMQPVYHGKDDEDCMRILYNLGSEAALVQGLGSVVTSKGRCIAFPNIYQHQVQPFQLKDSTKPGQRKILAFFLIDPTRPVPSATTILPQRKDWVSESVFSGLGEKYLPVESMDSISRLMQTVITKEQAHEIRLELMKERSKMIEARILKVRDGRRCT